MTKVDLSEFYCYWYVQHVADENQVLLMTQFIFNNDVVPVWINNNSIKLMLSKYG